MTSAFEYYPAIKPSPIIVICDHATNIVPQWVAKGDLGVSKADMERHIAYDIGILGLSEILVQKLNAHLVASRFSRLVVDPNRGADDPTLIMRIYDKTIIPANKDLSESERKARIDKLYAPYHAQINKVITEIRAAGMKPIVISMHSFTKQLRGKAERPWHIGILSNHDRRLTDILIEEFSAFEKICVGDNQPYTGALVGDTLDQHGLQQDTLHALIEVRNDLIETLVGQNEWADICANVINNALKKGNQYGKPD